MSKTIMVKGKPYIIPDGVLGITQEEYNKLSDEEKQGLWVITDREPVAGNPQSYKNMEIYSTEEIMIGVYKDKPLYSKTYICGASSGVANLVFDTRHDIEALIAFNGYVIKSPWIVAIPYGGGVHGVFIDDTTGQLMMGLSSSYTTISGAEITIKYTKKDDTLASITANQFVTPSVIYSTEERRIGTWVDGKPVYEKTFVFENLSIEPSSSITKLPVKASDYDIDLIVSTSGCAVLNGGNTILACGKRFNIEIENDVLYLNQMYANSKNTGNVTVTMRYTKTTD